MSETTMTIKLLSTGYWHVRLGPNRFAQWPQGEKPTHADFFGWWSEQDKREAIKAAQS